MRASQIADLRTELVLQFSADCEESEKQECGARNSVSYRIFVAAGLAGAGLCGLTTPTFAAQWA